MCVYAINVIDMSVRTGKSSNDVQITEEAPLHQDHLHGVQTEPPDHLTPSSHKPSH